ncbi:zinc finger protein 681-like [Melitaea cinxia]|uniref:zinc finger protein 681-like n=1 Tax=Melitaea cinxia TaxID=113334 RepID=UPI001E26E9F1|nr:zinc finger protein 681-like [Melitaea cinxia]
MTSLLLLKSMLFASVLQKNKKKKKIKTKKLNLIQEIDIKMCRICNASKGEISIFDNLAHPNISEDIKHFSGVSISKTDHLPKHICQNCLNLLNGCILFRDMCQSNNKMLIELSIKKESEINNSEVSTKFTQESDDSYNIPSPTFSEDNSETWGCTTCNKEFFDMVSYNTHLKSCNKTISEGPKEQSEDGHKKTFLCDICGKTARSNANLLVHMGIHENIFPFKCDQCPYQGRTMDLLKVHKRTHLADKPFKCTQCPKSTTTSSNLAKHMRHVHSTTRPYKCSYCDKAFSYQHDMKRHIRDIHLRQGTVECDVCFKKFNTKKILQGHRWKIHKIKGERHGRLPSYLQCQLGDDNENKSSDNEPIVYR